MSLNKVILIGNVGRDPEVKYFDNGNSIANFTIATNERGYRLQNGTEVPERTDWHNIVARRDQVPFVEKYVRKGSSVLIEGKLRYRDYEKDGIRRFITEIIADKVEFYGSARRSENSENSNGNYQAQQTQASPVQAAPAPVFNSATSADANPADDLPF
ncbi:MAG: single-stranded DNA-binding protein [Prevotellaceae bacterium]|jgi:single-strand DNA-binding protein|nr:single-stranded DNA-binding protein [Prevotellaceae bacterium]